MVDCSFRQNENKWLFGLWKPMHSSTFIQVWNIRLSMKQEFSVRFNDIYLDVYEFQAAF